MLCHFAHVPRWACIRWVGAGGCSTMSAGAGRHGLSLDGLGDSLPCGRGQLGKSKPPSSPESRGLCLADLQMGCFRRFAALDVRADYSVEYFLVPGGSSPAVLPRWSYPGGPTPVVLPSLSARTRLPHEGVARVALPPWIPLWISLMPRFLWVRPACS